MKCFHEVNNKFGGLVIKLLSKETVLDRIGYTPLKNHEVDNKYGTLVKKLSVK